MLRVAVYAIPLVAVGWLAYAFYMTPVRDELRLEFGEERWACAPLVANKPWMKDVGWVSMHSGLRVVVESRSSLSFLKLTCRHVDERDKCDFGASRWESVETRGETATISFDRKTSGVDASWFLDAPLSGSLAARIIQVFEHEQAVVVTSKDKSGDQIFSQQIDLAGFNDAMRACGF